jgi:inhibitor of KinA sporulation pathway (predicted exonuclease)
MYFIIDLEATCWENSKSPDLNEIIDIGIIVCNSKYEKINSWESLVKPSKNVLLSSFCKKLTSIKQNQIDSAKSLKNVFDDFYNWCNINNYKPTDYVWYTWGSWDLGCLIGDCERNKISFPFGEHRDLKVIYMQKKGLSLGDKCSVKDVLIRENLGDGVGLHRAMADASAAAKIAKFVFDLDSSQALS